MTSTAEQLESELSDLGLDDLVGPEQTVAAPDDAPPPEEEPPPEASDDPVGADDPSASPPTTDRARIAKASQALTRALDQLHTQIGEARDAAHALSEVLVEQNHSVPEAVSALASGAATDAGPSTDEGEQDDDTSVPQEP